MRRFQRSSPQQLERGRLFLFCESKEKFTSLPQVIPGIAKSASAHLRHHIFHSLLHISPHTLDLLVASICETVSFPLPLPLAEWTDLFFG